MGPNLGPVTIGKLLNLSVPQLLPLEKEFVTASTQYGCWVLWWPREGSKVTWSMQEVTAKKEACSLMVHLVILSPGTTIILPKRPPKTTEDKEETIQKLEVRMKYE